MGLETPAGGLISLGKVGPSTQLMASLTGQMAKHCRPGHMGALTSDDDPGGSANRPYEYSEYILHRRTYMTMSDPGNQVVGLGILLCVIHWI